MLACKNIVNTFSPILQTARTTCSMHEVQLEIFIYFVAAGRWGALFSHPAVYTPVCATKLGVIAKRIPKFEKHNVKVMVLSCDPVESHKEWIKDIRIQSYCPFFGDFPTPSSPIPTVIWPSSSVWWTLWRRTKQDYLSPAGW